LPETKTNTHNLLENSLRYPVPKQGDSMSTSLPKVFHASPHVLSEGMNKEMSSVFNSSQGDFVMSPARKKKKKKKKVSPLKKSNSGGPNMFNERVSAQNKSNGVKYVYIPKRLLERSGYDIFLKDSSQIFFDF
jgi:hypothetical protein